MTSAELAAVEVERMVSPLALHALAEFFESRAAAVLLLAIHRDDQQRAAIRGPPTGLRGCRGPSLARVMTSPARKIIALLWKFKKLQEPAVVAAAAVIGLIIYPLLRH